VLVRRRVGMVFQRSTPFPKSIFENVAYGLRIAGTNDPRTLSESVERALRRAALWDEVKDRLGESEWASPAASNSDLYRARARRRARGSPHGRTV